jgi:hypothetical protein
MTSLHRLWPEPSKAYAVPRLCRVITGVEDEEIDHAGPTLGNAITSAVR